MQWRVGEGTPVGRPEPAVRGDRPIQLVADEDPPADQVEGLAGHPLVVDGHGGQPVRRGAVPGDVHDLGPVAQRSQLVEGGEGRSGVGRLVAHGPVQLGGVPDGLVDGQPQVGGVDHQVVGAGRHRGGADLLGQQLGDLRQFGVPVPARPLQVLPPPAHRGCHRPHRLEAAVGIDGEGLDGGVDPDPPLVGLGARQVAVELVLGHSQDVGGHVVDGVGDQQPVTPDGQEFHLVGQGDLHRIDVVARRPPHLPAPRLVGQFHPAPTGAGDDLGRHHRFVDQCGSLIGARGHRRSEAQGAVDHHAHAHPELDVLGRPFQPGISQSDALAPEVLDP